VANLTVTGTFTATNTTDINAIHQGGDSFDAPINLGTLDAYPVNIISVGSTIASFDGWTGNTTLSSALDVYRFNTQSSSTVNGLLYINNGTLNALSVIGNANVTGNANITGLITASNISLSGEVTTVDLKATGNTILSGLHVNVNQTVGGTLTTSWLTATGVTNLNGTTNIGDGVAFTVGTGNT
jgi:hypothetical protein